MACFNHLLKKAVLGSIGVLILSSLAVVTAQGASITLAWNANAEPDLAGYRLHYGTVSGTYTQVIDVGNLTTATVPNLSAGSLYFFATTAYNTAGGESMPSNEVSYTTPPSPTATPIPLINVSPASVSFTAVVLGPPPAPQSIQITTSNGAPWSSFDTSPWFNARPASGASGSSTILTPSILGLLAGLFHENITFSAAGLPNRVVVVTLSLLASATPTPVPSPTPPSINLSGMISYCSNSVPGPVPNVTFTLIGSGSASALSDGSGTYNFSSLVPGGSYTVTPTMAPLAPGSAGINTLDVMAAQRHFLGTTIIHPGCPQTAADVNGVGGINTLDAVLIQRFFLQMPTAPSVGQYRFTPASRTYTGVASNQTGQDYSTLIFGDIVAPFADGMDNPSEFTTPAEVALPEIAVGQLVTGFTAEVTTTAIDPADNLVGFQGDFVFDERVISFQSEPIQNAGLTAGNWNVSANILPGEGPMRTLRVSAFSKDFMPLSGSGTLFNLNMANVNGTPGASTALTWAADRNQFIFINADLDMELPSSAPAGSVSIEHNP